MSLSARISDAISPLELFERGESLVSLGNVISSLIQKVESLETDEFGLTVRLTKSDCNTLTELETHFEAALMATKLEFKFLSDIPLTEYYGIFHHGWPGLRLKLDCENDVLEVPLGWYRAIKALRGQAGILLRSTKSISMLWQSSPKPSPIADNKKGNSPPPKVEQPIVPDPRILVDDVKSETPSGDDRSHTSSLLNDFSQLVESLKLEEKLKANRKLLANAIVKNGGKFRTADAMLEIKAKGKLKNRKDALRRLVSYVNGILKPHGFEIIRDNDEGILSIARIAKVAESDAS